MTTIQKSLDSIFEKIAYGKIPTDRILKYDALIRQAEELKDDEILRMARQKLLAHLECLVELGILTSQEAFDWFYHIVKGEGETLWNAILSSEMVK